MSPDVVIIGGGVVGCAIARELARRGAGRIVVVEKSKPGAEASSAAAGLLAVGSSRAPRGAVFELRCAGAARFPALAEALREETGIDVEYSPAGTLDLAFGAREAESLERHAARRREQGFEVELLDGDAVRALQPGLHPAVRAATLFPGDRSLNAPRLVQALATAAERMGVEFVVGAPVGAVETSNGKVLALEAGGVRLVPGKLVIAAGVGSAAVGALLGVKIPVRPDRGEMVALRAAEELRHPISWKEGYLVPRADGRILVGSTSARNEWEKQVTASSLALLLRRAIRMMPALENASVVRTWAGLRPLSTLRRPIIGPLRGFDDVLIATGHHRSGILLAPITAELLAELITGSETSIPIHPFCYRPR